MTTQQLINATKPSGNRTKTEQRILRALGLAKEDGADCYITDVVTRIRDECGVTMNYRTPAALRRETR